MLLLSAQLNNPSESERVCPETCHFASCIATTLKVISTLSCKEAGKSMKIQNGSKVHCTRPGGLCCRVRLGGGGEKDVHKAAALPKPMSWKRHQVKLSKMWCVCLQAHAGLGERSPWRTGALLSLSCHPCSL